MQQVLTRPRNGRLPSACPLKGFATSARMTTGNSSPFEECIVIMVMLSPPPLSASALIELARLWLVLVRNLRLPDKQKVSPLHRRLQKMLQYISLHFSEPITLEDLARSASISKSECGRVFRQALEKTPYQYLLEYRLQRGAELLSKTDLPIGAIAESAAY